ncbi:hypothetical protein DL546_008800 [Coniochaeta pulveracea]|uniref:Cyanovirin-N domain-containing protein n=1 Tax=Coniochaeta pulveracea TaxID=177199 RepID=A0A420YMX0_9PEZI|nr:hypothetical protein DL546_008800 [Coniochaeta pulveracea]
MVSWFFTIVVAVGWASLLAMPSMGQPAPHATSYPYFPNCAATHVNQPYTPNTEKDGRPIFSMSGTCGIPGEATQCTWFHLNRCYTNINGTLFPVEDGSGNFRATCTGCTTNDLTNPGYMYCHCNDTHGHSVPAQTDLRDHIYVDLDGVLGCPSVKGESCNTGW